MIITIGKGSNRTVIYLFSCQSRCIRHERLTFNGPGSIEDIFVALQGLRMNRGSFLLSTSPCWMYWFICSRKASWYAFCFSIDDLFSTSAVRAGLATSLEGDSNGSVEFAVFGE